MSKVIGGVFTLLGTLLSIYVSFLYMNTSSYLDYNAKKLSMLDTGLVMPAFAAFMLLSIGLTFLLVSKEPNTP